MPQLNLIEMSVSDVIGVPETGLFASNVWLQNMSQTRNLRLHGLQNKDRKLIAFWGWEESRKYGIKTVKTPSFSPTIPFWVSRENCSPTGNGSKIKNIMGVLAEDLRAAGGIVSVALPVGVCDTQPFTWQGFKVIVRHTYRLSLEKSEAEIFAGYTSKRRNDIFRARRGGVKVSICNDLEPAYYYYLIYLYSILYLCYISAVSVLYLYSYYIKTIIYG